MGRLVVVGVCGGGIVRRGRTVHDREWVWPDRVWSGMIGQDRVWQCRTLPDMIGQAV